MNQLELRLVPLAELADKFLKGNVKKHDIGALYQSIKRYGFRDPLGHDKNLNDGKGGIIEGNGRLECLIHLFKESPDTPPKGIVLEKDKWMVPVLFGCDSANEKEAIAYSLDHNLVMLKGGERSPYDILSQDFDEGVFDLLKEQFDNGVPTVAIDGDDLDSALTVLDNIDNQLLDFEDDADFEEEEDGHQRTDPNKYPLAFALDKETWEDWNSFKDSLGLRDDLVAFQRMLGMAQE